MIRQFSRGCQRRRITSSSHKMADLTMWLVAVVALLLLAYFATTRTHSYWRDRGVLFLKPLPLFGSLLPVITQRTHFALVLQRVYLKFHDEPFIGFFTGTRPALLIKDPELIKHIFVKDFSHFCNRSVPLNEKVNPLQAHNLVFMQDERWREMRSRLAPTFTSGRIKAMCPIIAQCALNLENHLASFADTGMEIDIKDLLARYTTDVIGNCAFGIHCDSINDPNCKFREMGRIHLEPNKLQALKRILIFSIPKLASTLKLEFTNREVSKFFRSLVSDVVSLRARTGQTRRDFMQLLIELKDKGRLAPEDDGDQNGGHQEHDAKRITVDEMNAQATAFYSAGFETSSSALTFALFELARQPELQRRARLQIEEVLQRHGGELSYEALQDMTYLDCILKESLRKYPPAVNIPRTCNKRYLLPGTKVTIDPDVRVIIPIYALQNDEKYFPNPDHFDPDRFSEENQKKNTPFVFMPFGEGPRQCIGMRFAKVQSKLGLVAVLRKFEVHPTRTKYPLTFDTSTFLLASKEDIFLTVTLAKKD